MFKFIFMYTIAGIALSVFAGIIYHEKKLWRVVLGVLVGFFGSAYFFNAALMLMTDPATFLEGDWVSNLAMLAMLISSVFGSIAHIVMYRIEDPCRPYG